MQAGNAGPFTLEGTRSHLVGRRILAIVDPGPDLDSHVRALVSRAAAAERVAVLVTHGHADHAGAASRVASELGAEIFGPAGVEAVGRALGDGDAVETDEGALVAVHTPGHTREHLCFHWPRRSAVFVGDLLLGRGDTTWVAEYPGCVADYLESLERLRSLEPAVLYPAHGPPLTDPAEALDRFERHRRERIAQVRDARRAHPGVDADALVDAVYGDTVPSPMRSAARRSLEAILDHIDRSGR